MKIFELLAHELSVSLPQIEATVKLIDEGNTIPFIARYRKEVTGSLDDTILRNLFDRLNYLRSMEKRREEVGAHIEEAGAMTDELRQKLTNAQTLAEIEDIYRPYRPKRKTRASVAKEKGLEPLAASIMEQLLAFNPLREAQNYCSEEKGVATPEEAIAGAQDIIAEQISDDAEIRKALRAFIMRSGKLASKATKAENTVYAMYADYGEPLRSIAPHRVLALDRGEREGVLKVNIEVESGEGLIAQRVVKAQNPSGQLVKDASQDSYRRLIFPALEREIRSSLTEQAAENAIGVFAVNLQHLLLAPPLKGRVTLGLDPAYRTGCKIAVVDATGKVVATDVIYPTPPHNKVDQAKQTLKKLIACHSVTTIAIGNGTASHESEVFVADLIRELESGLSYMVVSEAGASVYSASKLAAEEFPQFDVSLRSAASIARRLQDPLAELVKIDPKAIGVGQYQHDMPKARLDEALGGVVEACVNKVGVDLNTASHSLLSHISGVNNTVAKNIVAYREEQGAFADRKELLKVPKLGKKAYEQSAGFLRIAGGTNVLDNTSVHPESYGVAKKLLALCKCTAADVQAGKLNTLREQMETQGVAALAQQLDVGEPTLCDIVEALLKPGRDPRDELPAPLLRTDILKLEDLKAGTRLMGTVRNVIDFGAFVDIGVHEDGLVHISQIGNKFIKHPSEVLKVGDVVEVEVLEIDPKRKRIALTMKPVAGSPRS